MRLVILVVGGVAAGALSGTAVQTLIPQSNGMVQAVRAFGGNMPNISLADINPLKAYEDVRRKISSGDIGRSLNLGSSVSLPKVSSLKIEDLGLRNDLHIDYANVTRSWASTINNQIQQNNRRMEDLSAYARNPAAWHGVPPH